MRLDVGNTQGGRQQLGGFLHGQKMSRNVMVETQISCTTYLRMFLLHSYLYMPQNICVDILFHNLFMRHELMHSFVSIEKPSQQALHSRINLSGLLCAQ